MKITYGYTLNDKGGLRDFNVYLPDCFLTFDYTIQDREEAQLLHDYLWNWHTKVTDVNTPQILMDEKYLDLDSYAEFDPEFATFLRERFADHALTELLREL